MVSKCKYLQSEPAFDGMLRLHPRQTNVDRSQQSFSLDTFLVENADGQAMGCEGGCGDCEVHRKLLPVCFFVIPFHLYRGRQQKRLEIDEWLKTIT